LRGFDAAYSYGSYEGPLRELIHLYKYSGIQTLAGRLTDFLVMALPRDERFDFVTPVPLHWRRRWQRGFNQSELLAREIGRRCGIPSAGLLQRRRFTPSQAGLSNSVRRSNVTGAFGCRPAALRKRPIHAKNILLIDDVLTTGSTAAACAQALKRGGARRVALLTVARADRRMDGFRAAADHSRGRTS
jgi:ComF family protein